MDDLLVIGGGSLLGQKMMSLAANRNQVSATYCEHPFQAGNGKTFALDITDSEQVFSFISKMTPRAIVCCAAWVDIDGCERDHVRAHKINVDGPRNIATAARICGSKLIYASSGYVFSGNKDKYAELDEPSPVNYYGQTKLEGELCVRDSCPDSLIVRMPYLFGWNPFRLNFASWLVANLTRKSPITVVRDQWGNDTLADHAADAILKLLGAGASGIVHVGGPECISRLEFAVMVADAFQLDKDLIMPGTLRELDRAPRPQKCYLDASKLQREFGIRLPPTEQAIMAFKRQMQSVDNQISLLSKLS